MMAEGNSSGGFTKSRPVLGDLTNRLGKRGFSVREKSGNKSFDCNDTAKRIRVSLLPCTEINSLKENVVLNILKVPNENRDPNVPDIGSSVDVETDCDDGHCLKGKSAPIRDSKVHGGKKDIEILNLGGGIAVPEHVTELDVDNALLDSRCKIRYLDDDALSRMDNIGNQNCKGPNLTDLEGERAVNFAASEVNGGKVSSRISDKKNDPSLVDLGWEYNLQSVNVEANGKLDDNFLADTSSIVSESAGDCLHDGKDLDADENKASSEGTQSDINDYQNDGDDRDTDNLVLSQCGSMDCTILPDSQESRVFGVETSTEPRKGDERAYMSGGADSIKACSCSFCTKAAYIWLDLNYQDIKARISAMKKSHKEASTMTERIIGSKVIEKHGAESFNGVSKLESDLMYQWRSLFQHMTDIWQEEGNQLEARLQPLTDLREKCKTDLEFMNATLSEKH